MKTDRFLALDIGMDGIRMAEFSRAASGALDLLDSGSIEFASPGSGDMAREALVAMALKRLLDERKPKAKRAVVSIEGQSVFFRLVKLPMVGPDKVWQTIRHEAVQNIPFPIDEVVWDAHVVDSNVAEREVLLVAVKADLVNGLVHAVQANRLAIDRIEVAPVALANAVRHLCSGSSDCVLLVAGDAHATNLVFVDGTRTFFRTLPVPGSDLERLRREIDRSISFYRSQHGGSIPDRVLACGTAMGLCDSVFSPGKAAEPFDLDSIFGGAEQVDVENPNGVVAGLACPTAVSINLVPELLAKERVRRRRQPLLVAAAVALLLSGGVWIYGLNRLAALARLESEQVGARIQALETVEQQLVPLESELAGLEREAATYQAAIRKRMFWLDNMREIRRVLPDGMFLLSSEPLEAEDPLKGFRISVVSYLDKEPKDRDAVKELRDVVRASSRFSEETKVSSRPSKGLFARQFVLDVYIAEGLL